MTRRLAAHPSGEARPNGSLPENTPLLLVGGATATIRRLSPHPHLGRFTQPRSKNDLTDIATCGLWWAADNDALQGLDVDAYLTMIDQIARQPQDRLLFVTAPDAAELRPDGTVANSWEGTRWLWRSWRSALARRRLPLAIVAQDGATADSVPWSEIAAIFIGGSDAWKDGLEAARLALAARARGVFVHVGRINTQRRERLWWPLCGSFDGTQYSRWPDTHIPACLDRLRIGQRAMTEELLCAD
jgi:hypothetical protein